MTTENNEIIVRNITEGLKQDSIELTKNSKGYTWVIKKYGDMSTPEATQKLLMDIAEINATFSIRYGVEIK